MSNDENLPLRPTMIGGGRRVYDYQVMWRGMSIAGSCWRAACDPTNRNGHGIAIPRLAMRRKRKWRRYRQEHRTATP
jgi:hypothetical protein